MLRKNKIRVKNKQNDNTKNFQDKLKKIFSKKVENGSIPIQRGLSEDTSSRNTGFQFKHFTPRSTSFNTTSKGFRTTKRSKEHKFRRTSKTHKNDRMQISHAKMQHLGNKIGFQVELGQLREKLLDDYSYITDQKQRALLVKDNANIGIALDSIKNDYQPNEERAQKSSQRYSRRRTARSKISSILKGKFRSLKEFKIHKFYDYLLIP